MIKSSQIPVELGRLDQTVVIIRRGVGGSLLRCRDSTAQQDGIHLVGARGRALVKGQDDKSPGDVEIGVCEERCEPISGPGTSD